MKLRWPVMEWKRNRPGARVPAIPLLELTLPLHKGTLVFYRNLGFLFWKDNYKGNPLIAAEVRALYFMNWFCIVRFMLFGRGLWMPRTRLKIIQMRRQAWQQMQHPNYYGIRPPGVPLPPCVLEHNRLCRKSRDLGENLKEDNGTSFGWWQWYARRRAFRQREAKRRWRDLGRSA